MENRVPWLEIALAASTLMLVCQAIPTYLWLALSLVDVRNWNWLHYASAFGVLIAILIVAKGRQEST